MINKKNDHTSKCMIIIAAKSYDYSLRARLASVNALPAAKSSELTENVLWENVHCLRAENDRQFKTYTLWAYSQNQCGRHLARKYINNHKRSPQDLPDNKAASLPYQASS